MIKDWRLPIKEDFLKYLAEVPSYRFASKSVKKSEDTMLNWRKEDPDFSEQCESVIADWVKRTVKRTKPEFQLERILRDDFAQRTEVTGRDGQELTVKMVSYEKIDGNTSPQ